MICLFLARPSALGARVLSWARCCRGVAAPPCRQFSSHLDPPTAGAHVRLLCVRVWHVRVRHACICVHLRARRLRWEQWTLPTCSRRAAPGRRARRTRRWAT